MSGNDEAERIKRDFPICTAIADELRRVFGPDVRLIYIQEGGRERGRKSAGRGVSLAQVVLNPAPPPEKEKPRRSRRRWEEMWQPEEEGAQ